MEKEFAHYVVTAHQPGGVLTTAKCNFSSEYSMDVLVAKSRRLEVRQLRPADADGAQHVHSPFPVIVQVPINGRIVCMHPIKIPSISKSLVFIATDRFRYAVLAYDDDDASSSSSQSPYPIRTLCSGSVRADNLYGSSPSSSISHPMSRMAESGPLVTVDPLSRCIAMHLYDGIVSVIPINTRFVMPQNYKDDGETNTNKSSYGASSSSSSSSLLGEVFHCRLEERVLMDMTFLIPAAGETSASSSSSSSAWPQLAILHQDARGAQHLMSYGVHLQKQSLHRGNNNDNTNEGSIGLLKKSMVDGGSSLLIPVAPGMASSVAAASAASASTSEIATGGAKTTNTGGVVILGQRQFTYCSGTVTKVIPVPQAMFLAFEELPPDPSGMPRFLIADEFGNLHMLTLVMYNAKVTALNFETLGSCALASSLAYLRDGLVYVASNMGDSQLVQIHDEPIAASEDTDNDALLETTYLSVVEEYTHLGPILDFDLIPTTPGTTADAQMGQCQVVTASGSSKTGSIRLVRNGIGMNEYASVEIPGIQHMWSIRKSFHDKDDTYLVQSFVGETRVLGVVPLTNDKMDDGDNSETEVGGSLEEVEIPGLDSASASLFVGNVQEGDRFLQITESEIRLLSMAGAVLDSCFGSITVATANEAGQIAVSMSGGMVVHYCIDGNSIKKIGERQMEREVSCLDIHPFESSTDSSAMDVDGVDMPHKSKLVAVGLWDDFTVRLLHLEENLPEAICISLGNDDDEEEEDEEGNLIAQRRHLNNMMARSLCLITLDFNSASAGAASHANSPGVDMLLVGLGDGTLISFAVVARSHTVYVQAKKEVCLGTQRIGLVPLKMEGGGTCVLATGDRPTVIYLAGVGGTSSSHFNPKLCYSNVNLSSNDEEEIDDTSRLPSQQTIAVNVATPFYSPLLFDAGTLGTQHYSLCVADHKDLKLGVIDDIQKLHVTTCRIGMAPRRIAHCADGRLLAVGCVESGINHLGLGEQEQNMQNCIRFMDDTSFDDIERIDMEPFEMIMSMFYATLKVPSTGESCETLGADGEPTSATQYKPFLLVGTAYALPDEDEPTRGRILVYSFQEDEASTAASSNRCVRQVTELATQGAVYSISQFYEGKVLCTVNSKTYVAQLVDDAGLRKLQILGTGHHGHILSVAVRSLAKRVQTDSMGRDVTTTALTKNVPMDVDHQKKGDETKKSAEPDEMLAIVGDLMRSIALVQYYPQHETLEEIAKDFTANWVTAVEMLNSRVYLGAENWNNLFCLRRNVNSQSEEVRARLDNIGEFHLGEMVNKFMSGSLVMRLAPSSSSSSGAASASSSRRRVGASPQKKKAATPTKNDGTIAPRSVRRPVVVTGSQTLFGTVDGTLGVILGLDGRTAAFLSTLERALAAVIRPVGDLSHAFFRAVEIEGRVQHPAHGFIDGDLVEGFLDLDRNTMQAVVDEMNRDGGWEVDDTILRKTNGSEKKDGDQPSIDDEDVERPDLTVDDTLAMVEEMIMLH